MIRTASSPLFHLLSVREEVQYLSLFAVTNLRVVSLTTELVNTVTRLEGLHRSFVQMDWCENVYHTELPLRQ